jgi:hypothetical protein
MAPRQVSSIIFLADLSGNRGDQSKGDDSYSETRKKYLANEAKRFEREQAWVQSLNSGKSKPMQKNHHADITLTPSFTLHSAQPPENSITSGVMCVELKEPPHSISIDGDVANIELPQSANVIRNSTLNLNTNSNDEQEKYLPTSGDTGTDLELQPQSEELPESLHRGNSNQRSPTVFGSLYLRASQVFPLGSASRNQGNGGLTPHQELSYHSIVSHHESSVYDAAPPLEQP